MAVIAIHDQTNILPRAKLLVVLGGLSTTMLISFIDQTAIGIALPTIGADLNAATTIMWAGTSSLISNTVFQVLYGRLSDIFGRKIVMLMSLAFLSIGDLLCGFAKTGPQLYAFRAISGIGNGGIMATQMMIVSDVVTLQDRGKYQGILGSMIGLGSVIGPFLAAGFTESTSWRYIFFFIAPVAAVIGVVIFVVLPPSDMPKDGLQIKLRKIDFAGIAFSSSSIILLLIPISGMGSYFMAQSPMVISMLTIGGICGVLFILTEWKIAKLPMLPPRLFQTGALCAMLVQNFLIGITYFGLSFYLPVYYQSVHGYSVLMSAALVIPLVVSQIISSTLAGYYISKMGRYGEVVLLGFVLWTLATGLHCLYSRTTSKAVLVIVLFIEGWGVGCIFQPTLIAAQAYCLKEDRAVVISARNFSRSLGGACGLAIASTIYTNTLERKLPRSIPQDIKASILNSVFRVPNLSKLSAQEKRRVIGAYLSAIRSVFWLWAACMGTCLVLMVFIKDKGLQRDEEKESTVELQVMGEPQLVVAQESGESRMATQIGNRMEKSYQD